jgi:GT2 family glycosyltransferase
MHRRDFARFFPTRWTASMAEVAVVVGNYQGGKVLPACLESLARQTRPPAEVIVADASSTDASRNIALDLGARFLTGPNNGLGFLYNLGARSTSCEYVLLSNNDVAYEPDCVELLVCALEEDKRRFAADPTQLDWAGTTTIHARTTIRPGRLVREYLPGLRFEAAAPAEVLTPTVSANGAAMLVRRSMLLELGGFDETFFMDYEDLDLCWRAWHRGWPTVYVPDARLRHHVGAVTTASVRPRRSASAHHNLIRFALKCLPWPNAALIVTGEIVRLPRHPQAVGHGLAAVVRELPEILRARRSLQPSRQVFEELLAL